MSFMRAVVVEGMKASVLARDCDYRIVDCDIVDVRFCNLAVGTVLIG